MGKYAHGTEVPVGQSRTEIERILTKYGADQVSTGWTAAKAVIMFRIRNRYVRIELPLPQPDIQTKMNSPDRIAAETRRRWRAMVLYVKAKLESVESDIVTFEHAFMAHLLLPNKQTVGEFMQPQIEQAYSSGNMPKALPGY